MPEYDAFGREIGENTLSGLGGDAGAGATPASPEPAPATAPAPAEERTADPPPPAREAPAAQAIRFEAPAPAIPGVRVRRARGVGCLVGLLILAVVVAVPVIAVVGFVGEAGDVIDDVTDAIDSDALDLPEVPRATPPTTGIAGRSMLAPDNLAAALRDTRRAGFTRASRIDLRPERLTVTAVKGRRERDIVFSAEGGVDRGAAARANAATGSLALSALDPAAPARLVRAAAERFPVRAKGINYVLTGPESGGPHWRAYFKNGVYVEGDARGRILRRFDGG